MLRSLDGDAAAYRRLLAELRDRLGRYFARRAPPDGGLADDLVQETLMAIHAKRATFDRTQPVTPWAYAIARYKLIDHLRQTRALMSDVPVENAEDLLAQDDHTATESAYDVKGMLNQLPDKMRRTIQLTKLEGLSVAEVASRCNMSESDVKVSVHRGMKALMASIARKRAPQ